MTAGIVIIPTPCWSQFPGICTLTAFVILVEVSYLEGMAMSMRMHSLFVLCLMMTSDLFAVISQLVLMGTSHRMVISLFSEMVLGYYYVYIRTQTSDFCTLFLIKTLWHRSPRVRHTLDDCKFFCNVLTEKRSSDSLSWYLPFVTFLSQGYPSSG